MHMHATLRCGCAVAALCPRARCTYGKASRRVDITSRINPALAHSVPPPVCASGPGPGVWCALDLGSPITLGIFGFCNSLVVSARAF
jgi:hypothetical protein